MKDHDHEATMGCLMATCLIVMSWAVVVVLVVATVRFLQWAL